MIHLGDVNDIHGWNVPTVDCIIGGSPCQDLSVAGNRKGLDGERSGLFMQQIRIVKEMRYPERYEHIERPTELVCDTGDTRRKPRFMLWENVPGAFSSGKIKGADFAAVLTECVRVKEENAPDVPIPAAGWPNAGVIMGDGFSIAWKVCDLQYYGCPQRRKRISLLCDFDGLAAPEIIFEQYTTRRCESGLFPFRESLPGDTEQSAEEGKEVAGDFAESPGKSDKSYTLQIRGGVSIDSHGKGAGKGPLVQEEKCGALGTVQDKTLFANSSGGGYKWND